jgi:hypothetical protein
MPVQAAVPGARKSPGSAPITDGGVSAFIAEQIGGSGTSSSQGL